MSVRERKAACVCEHAVRGRWSCRGRRGPGCVVLYSIKGLEHGLQAQCKATVVDAGEGQSGGRPSYHSGGAAGRLWQGEEKMLRKRW